MVRGVYQTHQSGHYGRDYQKRDTLSLEMQAEIQQVLEQFVTRDRETAYQENQSHRPIQDSVFRSNDATMLAHLWKVVCEGTANI
ncbi:hypothetical protein I7I50_07878 [Histoplasma capsulatum G186AR]|uniref:Uncharacterized protein n=1 Tax=Ajellomyces capsulatus TaxID=5037 RepID=A0A8H8CVF1_AJECA|nr:hypothetical protein I7I52_08394 [Histoplasma capsulatum]QSS68457.1 hypothetical protein I7I50_07878 [Histoplasma capsulatum G186AR]